MTQNPIDAIFINAMPNFLHGVFAVLAGLPWWGWIAIIAGLALKVRR